jgi:hypothetical protein
MTVKTQGGKVITKGGKVSCSCCDDCDAPYSPLPSSFLISFSDDAQAEDGDAPAVPFPIYIPITGLSGTTVEYVVGCLWCSDPINLGSYTDPNGWTTNNMIATVCFGWDGTDWLVSVSISGTVTYEGDTSSIDAGATYRNSDPGQIDPFQNYDFASLGIGSASVS